MTVFEQAKLISGVKTDGWLKTAINNKTSVAAIQAKVQKIMDNPPVAIAKLAQKAGYLKNGKITVTFFPPDEGDNLYSIMAKSSNSVEKR